MATDKNSTSYIITFAVILITITALLLSLLATGLKKMQKANVDNEKRVFILSAAGEFTMEQAGKKSKSEIEEIYFNKISSYVIDAKGNVLEDLNAFDLDVVKEFRATSRNPELRRYALFTYNGESTKYIIPMAGNGLWGPVWAYVALKSDKNTIDGVVFDHKSETPGLGAEITEKWFRDMFTKNTKQIVDEKGVYRSVDLVKGKDTKGSKHEVDAIAGSTITSKGVAKMLQESFKPYVEYWGSLQSAND